MRRVTSARSLVARLSMAAVGVGWLSVGWGGATLAPPAASAAVEHRAAVIIDTGSEVKSVCVRFQEESLTGVELLARAGADPVFQGFAGKGAAVCALCGVGCPAGESCLTCNAEGRFWSYSRAPAGTGTLRTSGVGASSTVVRNGDVEGWRWGLGGTPPFATVEQVCGEAPVLTSTTAASPVVTSTGAGPATAPAAALTTSATAATRAPAASTTTRVAAETSTTQSVMAPGGSAADEPAAAEPAGKADGAKTTASDLAAARTSSRRGAEGSSWRGLFLFGLIMIGLVAWGASVRRRRRTPA